MLHLLKNQTDMEIVKQRVEIFEQVGVQVKRLHFCLALEVL